MEQRNQRSGIGIDARQIGPFVPIASITSERETGGIVGAAVLFRHDVFHMECNQRRYRLGRRQYSHAFPARVRTRPRVR